MKAKEFVSFLFVTQEFPVVAVEPLHIQPETTKMRKSTRSEKAERTEALKVGFQRLPLRQWLSNALRRSQRETNPRATSTFLQRLTGPLRQCAHINRSLHCCEVCTSFHRALLLSGSCYSKAQQSHSLQLVQGCSESPANNH